MHQSHPAPPFALLGVFGSGIATVLDAWGPFRKLQPSTVTRTPPFRQQHSFGFRSVLYFARRVNGEKTPEVERALLASAEMKQAVLELPTWCSMRVGQVSAPSVDRRR